MRSLLPLFAGLLLLLCGCSVIETIADTPSKPQIATGDAEIVVVTDALNGSGASPVATATPALEQETATPDIAEATEAEETDEAEETPALSLFEQGISPTTGRQLPEGAVYRPALVAIDNAAQARPQTALMLADVVYEFPLDRADHQTRYLALFSDTLPARVGPVRTSRAYLAQTALEWGGLYVSLGDPEMAANGYPLLEGSGIPLRAENAGDAAAYFYRDKTISSIEEHTLFFKLQSYIETQAAFSAEISESRFSFEHGVNYEKGKEIHSVGLPFTSSDAERVVFTYDKAHNLLIRSDKNSKKVLGVSKSLTPTDDTLGYANETIAVQNLIVQYVRVSAYDGNYRSVMLTGKGDCMYFVNGRAVFGSWSRPTLDDPTAYKLYDGTILRLEPGNTWIMMMPSTREIKIRYVG